MVLQDTHLFTGTVADNIRYGNLTATDEEVVKAAKLANAISLSGIYPKVIRRFLRLMVRI
jgi:ATP-binding cassette subfamily B protein